jgi:tripartite motif-containing protein 2/3
VFAHNGEFKFSLGGNLQSTAKILRRPIGIDSTSDNRILVVDYEFKCVNVFEENGKFLSKICQGKLLGPKGICVNRHDNNQIIIADSKSNCVCIFDCEGKFLNRFGNLGNKNENFAGPQYVACLKNGDIAITDFYNHCIKIFDCQGQFRFSFGSNGLNQGQFNGPTGITTDKDDNIIVVDWGNSRIQVISFCISSFHKISFF